MTELSDLKQQILNWANATRETGLLSTGAVETLGELSEHTPANLFASGERPLVVGFFGGTGVGKSTLLNRLAGENVARTSVERPTSREVTMYLHESVQVDQLPSEFPVDKIRRAVHSNADNRHILWIDMPDFDSAETANRQLVSDWLPHIDLLIYVVSPERYRDDHGWRLLQQHGLKHAWCFVINHWDRGNEVQREDFQSMLVDAGLPEPLLFCTDSSGSSGAATTDEFPALRTTVSSLADRNTIDQLEARGVSIRASEMQASLNQALLELGTETQHASLADEWTAAWREDVSRIAKTLQWKYAAMSQPYNDSQSSALVSIVRSVRGQKPATEDQTQPAELTADTPNEIFDPDSFEYVRSALENQVQLTAEHQLPAAAVRRSLEQKLPDLPDTMNAIVSQNLQQSLAAPGTALQRAAYRGLGVLTSLLPLLAIGWAGYRIVSAFYAGSETPAAYVSSNFAINAGLLVLLAWAAPFFLRRWVKPSRRQAARRGLRQGTEAALQHAGDMSQQLLRTLQDDCSQAKETAAAIFSASAASAPTAPVSPALTRAIVQDHAE